MKRKHESLQRLQQSDKREESEPLNWTERNFLSSTSKLCFKLCRLEGGRFSLVQFYRTNMSTGRGEAVGRLLMRCRAAGSPCWRRLDGQRIRRGEAWQRGATSSPTGGAEGRRKDYTT